MNVDQFDIHRYQCSSFHQKFFQFQVDKQQYMYNCLQDFHKLIQMDNRTRQSCIHQRLDMIHRHHLYDSLILFQFFRFFFSIFEIFIFVETHFFRIQNIFVATPNVEVCFRQAKFLKTIIILCFLAVHVLNVNFHLFLENSSIFSN